MLNKYSFIFFFTLNDYLKQGLQFKYPFSDVQNFLVFQELRKLLPSVEENTMFLLLHISFNNFLKDVLIYLKELQRKREGKRETVRDI